MDSNIKKLLYICVCVICVDSYQQDLKLGSYQVKTIG